MGPLLAIASTTQRGREPGRLHTAPSPVTILVPIPLTPFPLSVPLYRSWCQSLPTPSTSCVTFIVSSFSGLPPWPSHSLPLATSSSRPRASPSLPPSLLTPPFSPSVSSPCRGREGGRERGRKGGREKDQGAYATPCVRRGRSDRKVSGYITSLYNYSSIQNSTRTILPLYPLGIYVVAFRFPFDSLLGSHLY